MVSYLTQIIESFTSSFKLIILLQQRDL